MIDALQVYVISEMVYEDILAANARGVVVILTGQSTMERAYLRRCVQKYVAIRIRDGALSGLL